ncbi:hypothetical protein SAMN05444156_0921 [Verrucomicrobium sp. GAS474]|uniref:hypothetical protein n=1 Tax=Verrucomicrobium sp. GAS474 TaxID=1882831 RepID=UPI00087D8B27|nr:hypothetical protein [Verrucomicrobium sp. GAS474]SDT94041.1 hypothetical protein SAMN05444156_0921 [Verrucomicrobium sp. GAS474]
MKPIRILASALALCAGLGAPSSLHAEEGRLLWRLGAEDGSSAEFTGTSIPSAFAIPENWATRTSWPEWAAASDKRSDWTCDLSYTLDAVPKGGALFAFKPVTASPYVPELAVFSNGFPCGIIQVGGASYPGIGVKAQEPKDRRFAREHRIYIPREFLVEGKNTLRVQRLGHPYNRNLFLFIDFTIDYLRLSALDKIPDEPLHGNLIHLGYSEGQFDINPQTIATAQPGHEWMGVAYSNNPERATFWDAVRSRQSPADQSSYLQKLKELNMAVILNGWGCDRTTDAQIVDGQLPENAKTYLSNLLRTYGSMVQYYEICNEPTQNITKASYQYCLAVARYVLANKPATLVLIPPGYSFGGGWGDPKNWDGTAEGRENRRALDALCGAYNGHSFGQSYLNSARGGSLIENIDTHGTLRDGVAEVPNGFDKPFITTEMGAATSLWDLQEIGTNRYASSLDRNLRAHIAFADLFCAADLWRNGVAYNYLTGTPDDPATWQAAPCSDGKDPRGGPDSETRVKVLRRLALAYSTHGRPLPYVYADPEAARNQLVYFRAVDTSALAPLPGSGATSRKILLSFVNFDEQKPHDLAVRVTLPFAGKCTAVRYGPEPSYTAARSEVSLDPKPELELSVKLGPGEAAEYIVEPPA